MGEKFFMSNPDLYQIGIDYSCYSIGLFVKYLLYGLVQSIIVYFITFLLIG